MGRLKRRSILSRKIAEILGTGDPFGPTGHHPGATRFLLMGGVALMALNPSTVNAIGLGEIVLESRLGEPLRATVPMKVTHGEILPANCVTARPRQAGLRVPETVRVSSPAANAPGSYSVQISTALPLHEPMYELSLVVECPDIPFFVHHYVLLIELPESSIQPATSNIANAAPSSMTEPTGSQNTSALEPASPDPASKPAPDDSPAPDPAIIPVRLLTGTREAIPAGTRYRVRRGDTLSGIAERIAGRPPDTIWRVSQRIFMTNEHAFISSNSDLIKLGAVIRIPDVTELMAFARPASSPTNVAPAISSRQSRVENIAPPMPVVPDTVPATTSLPEPTPAVTKPETPEPVAASTFADKKPAIPADLEKPSDPVVSLPAPDAVSELSSAPDAPVPDAATPDPAAMTTADSPGPVPNNEISPWIAIGTGILLGFSLSLLMLRQRLIEALVDLFRRKPRSTRFPIWQTVRSKRSSKAQQTQADSLLSEANEFLDTIAEDAFQTNAQYNDHTGIIPVGKPIEDTYIVEVEKLPNEPTMKEVDPSSESGVLADTEVIEENAKDAVEASHGESDMSDMSDDVMLAHLFDAAYLKAGDVIDPTSDVSSELPEETPDPVSEIIDPTAEVPEQQWPEPIDPTSDIPIFRQIEPIDPIDPTVDMPGQSKVPEIDPTADMPIRAFDTSLLQTREMPKRATEEANDEEPDHSSQIPMDAFGIDQATLSEALAEELGDIDPDTLFQTSDSLDDSPTDRNLAQLLAQVEEDTVQTEVNEEDTFANTLGNAMSLLDREYEDEFTASQVLEGTAIRESLDGRDAEDPELENSELEEPEDKHGQSNAG